MVESELFAHVKGAFTGAAAKRKGHFELADGGTLFHNEISDMPLDLQAKSSRALAANNIDFQTKIAEGTFREGLYYQLAQFPVVVSPLRERTEDISLLAEHFLNLFAKEMSVEAPTLSDEALSDLTAYPFSRN